MAYLINPAALKFLGAFLLPRVVFNEATSYAPGCFALRQTGDKLSFFSDAHIYTNGKIYQGRVPDKLGTKAPYPIAKIVRKWDDIYGGKRPDKAGEGVVTTGLHYAKSVLWWVFGRKYWTGSKTVSTYGLTQMATMQSLVVNLQKTSHHWRRGGVMAMPNDQVGFGFGGYYSIFEGGSYGPALTRADRVLLAHPEPYRAQRPTNYRMAAGEKSWVGRDPVGGVGSWTAADEIGGEDHAGGAAWISGGQYHGVIFFASLGQGRIAYEGGGVRCQTRSDYMYVYHPYDLERVAAGELRPWEPKPRIYPFGNRAPGLKGRIAGVSYDAATRRLYVNYVNAYEYEGESYPAVTVYRVGDP